MTDTVHQRFWSKVRLLPTGCLLWAASLTNAGYGNFKWDTSQPMSAHRAAWLLAENPLPEKPFVLDHTCRNRWCVNVEHLEIVTYSQNVLRGDVRRNVSVCRSGRHPWTPENQAPTSSGPTCRECKLENQRMRYARRA